MNWKRNLKAFGAFRFAMLVIAALLTVLPVSASHAMPHGHLQKAATNHSSDHAAMTHLGKTDSDCQKHATRLVDDQGHGTISCCNVFCATVAFTEAISINTLSFARPSFLPFVGSAVLPGEYTTPHRPPNA
ncbi:MAG: hypothetical protein WBC71_08730 [Salaquimonas sp.]